MGTSIQEAANHILNERREIFIRRFEISHIKILPLLKKNGISYSVFTESQDKELQYISLEKGERNFVIMFNDKHDISDDDIILSVDEYILKSPQRL